MPHDGPGSWGITADLERAGQRHYSIIEHEARLPIVAAGFSSSLEPMVRLFWL